MLYIFIFYEVKLYSDMLLHVVYVVMQFYGWYYWLYGSKRKDSIPVTRNRLSHNLLLVCLIATLTVSWGYLMARATNAALPYPDAFTTVASLFAQWLLARKKLESWLIWIAVDIVAIGVYTAKDLYLTAGLYAVFLCMASAGYLAWKKCICSTQTIDENRTDTGKIRATA